jgi:hypothetical protein
MGSFIAKGNTVVDSDTGQQIAVVLAVACTKKLAREMAAFAAQQANHAAKHRSLQAGALSTATSTSRARSEAAGALKAKR